MNDDKLNLCWSITDKTRSNGLEDIVWAETEDEAKQKALESGVLYRIRLQDMDLERLSHMDGLAPGLTTLSYLKRGCKVMCSYCDSKITLEMVDSGEAFLVGEDGVCVDCRNKYKELQEIIPCSD